MNIRPFFFKLLRKGHGIFNHSLSIEIKLGWFALLLLAVWLWGRFGWPV